MLYLRTFGGLRLENGGRPIVGAGAQRSRLGLLAVLAAAGDRGVSRESLFALLWPEGDTEFARRALKQAVYALRRDLAEVDLVVGTADLTLNSAIIASDVGCFNPALASGDPERAVLLYEGVFLEGVHLPGGEFERWVDQQRDHLATRYREALQRLATSAEQLGDQSAAVRWWRRLAVADPLSAQVARSLMLALSSAGDRPAALRHARIHEQLVRAELDLSPDHTILELAHRLRRETPGRESNSVALPGPALPRPATSDDRPVLLESEDRAVVPATDRSRDRGLRWLGAGVGLLTLALAGLTLRAREVELASNRVVLALQSPSPEGSSARLVLAELASALGERNQQAGIATSIAAGLGGSANLSAIAQAAAARYVVIVVVSGPGDSVRVAAQLSDARTAAPLGSPELAALGPDRNREIRLLGDRIAIALASRANPLLANWGYAAALPRTWSGYQQLSEGIRAFATDGPLDLDHFRAAAALDSTGATPLVWLAFAYRDRDSSEQVLNQLEHSERRFGPWDRGMVAFLRATNRGDQAATHDAGHVLLQVVPRSAWVLPVAGNLLSLGRVREAAALLREFDPDSGWTAQWQFGWTLRDAVLHTLGDYQAELDLARKAERRFPDSRLQQQSELKALAALGSVSEVEQICEVAMSRRPVSNGQGGWDWQPCQQAFAELRAHGHPDAARQLADRLLAWRRQTVSTSAEAQVADLTRIKEDLGDWAGLDSLLRARPASDSLDAGYLESLSLVQAARGNRGGLAETLRRLDSRAAGKPRTPEEIYERARIPALLGDRDEAVALFAMALREGFGGRRLAHLEPAFDGLRGYPPYEALIHPKEDPAHLAKIRR
jgi:DNA-binding SARP family transcriptional activator